jgi:hypothetical protein
MESTLKSLFFRRRTKSKPPAVKDTPQASFQQTSGYAAVPSGPAPKVGALPLKPSQEKQPRKSFSHTKAKSDGLQETRQVVESANIGRPRTSPGVKPYFVGVSKPNGSGTPSGPSSRGTSIDGAAAEDMSPPPVPPLPKDLDNLRGPRYHDIMQYAAKQQISRATFNEHVAARNMGLPRKSVDIFETEVNQLSGGRYNEYVAMRNIDPPRQSIDRFEEEVALRNTAPSDPQRTSFDAMRASREGQRHQSRNNGVETPPNKTPTQGMLGAETFANTHVARIGKAKPLKTGNDTLISGSDAPTSVIASSSQAAQPSRVALHSRQHSWKQNDQLGELSSIPQSRTADFMPPEWLSHGYTTISSDGRTRSMTAAIPSRLRNDGLGDHDASAHFSTNEKPSPAPTFWNARNQVSQHSASRSLSMLEGPSRREAVRPTTSTGQRGLVAERPAPHEISSSRADDTLTGIIPRTKKRIELSGRTVMDLTDELPDSSNDNAGHPAFHELSGEPQQRIVYHSKGVNPSRRILGSSTTHASKQHTVSEIDASESLRNPKPTSSRVGRSNEHDMATITPFETAGSTTESTAAIGGNSERVASGSTSQSAAISDPTDSQVASFHNPVTGPVQSLASNPRQQGQFVDPNCDEVSRQSQYVYASPESLKSNDFTNPTRAFGVTARDFAVSPTHKQSPGTLKEMTQPQGEPKSNKFTPLLTTQLPARQDKVVHHISSFTLPPKQPRTRQSGRDRIAFDEDAFQRKQAEARAALLRLERDLQDNFTFAFDSLNKTAAQDAPVHFRNISVEEDGPVAPISRFSSVHAPTSVYQNKVNGSTSGADTPLGEKSPQQGPSIPGLAMTSGVSVPSIHSTLRNQNRNSMISTISETDAEPLSPDGSAPAPTIPLSSASERGRSITSRQPGHGRMHSTASTGSRASAFSVPHHLVPDRTSSMRDSEVPPFHIDDAGWE